MRAVPGLVPGSDGYVDQVARWLDFKRRHPGAEKAVAPPVWTGSLVVRGSRREVSRSSLEGVIDALERLAAVEAEALAIEAAHPGWHVWLSDIGRWYAVRSRPRSGGPMTVDGDDAAGLRAALEALRALRMLPRRRATLSAPGGFRATAAIALVALA